MDMTLNAFTLSVLTGLQLGSIYVLIALGLTLIFGTLGVVNFAHGALYLIAIYLAVSINNALGFGLALILVPPILFVIGVLLERGLIQRFYNRPHTDQILVTFGLAIVLQELLKWIFGANNIPFAIPSWGNGIIMLHDYLPFLEGFVVYPKWRMILVVVAIVTVSAVFALLHLTRFGLVIRAGMRDAEMLQFLGVNINRRFMIVFGLGCHDCWHCRRVWWTGDSGLTRSGHATVGALLPYCGHWWHGITGWRCVGGYFNWYGTKLYRTIHLPQYHYHLPHHCYHFIGPPTRLIRRQGSI